MTFEESNNEQYEVNHDELLERNQFPHISFQSDKNGHMLILSTGHELYLGQVHPAAIEHLLMTVRTINKLAYDPEMLSYDRLKNEFGE